jgi:ATPase subunit of ABC transporter with duplicated ATPase domains
MRPASSILLSLRDVAFAYDGMTEPLFTALNADFPVGWTGVVGANGAGKTTLLRIAAGELELRQGRVARDGSACYVAQRTDAPPEDWEAFFWAPDAGALKARLRIGEDWDAPNRWDTLSHGERKRAQLAVALWREPALLALDEPTNHIDASARELLASALRDFRGAGLLVSHDRELLDALCSQCLILDPPSAVMRPGGVTAALAQQDNEETARREKHTALRHEASRLHEETQRRRELADQKTAAARGSKTKKKNDHDERAKRFLAQLTNKDAWAGKQAGNMLRRAGKVSSQAAALNVKKRYETGIWVEDASYSQRDFLLRLPAGSIPLVVPPSGGLSHACPNPPEGGTTHPDGFARCLHHPELAIGGKDRIALTGGNGLGKSTLLRHILPKLAVEPERLIYVPQEITADESRTILEQIKRLPEAERGRVMTAVSRLGSRPGRLLESAQPSPGEVRKLLLALGIVRGPHLIVMDEPTNHLDLPGILCLENALAECPCAMLLVSHDARFLARTTAAGWHIRADGGGASMLEIRQRDQSREAPESI